MPRAWSRRSVLVALGVASATTLTGCGVRLELYRDDGRIEAVALYPSRSSS